MRIFALPILFLLAGMVLSGCNGFYSRLDNRGVSVELATFRAAGINDVVYTIHLTIPENDTLPILGKETIEATLSDLSEPLILDFKAPVDYVESIFVNGNKVAFRFLDEHILIDEDNFTPGRHIIKINFRAGETSLNRNPEFLYTLFVPERARTAFPCFDQPNLKARFNLTLTMPRQWQALANGPIVEEKLAAEQKTLKFAETKPISTYLFSFVAGDFKVVTRQVDGRQMTMLHRETDSVKVAGNLDAIFALHKTAINWLEDYTGIAYPFQKFGFALIPSFQYGGMEHPGAITYKASSLLLDENPTQNQLLGRASLIAHETAHMWFGDMVTMDWFDDVWMKEVFANFMAAKIVNPSFPEINHDLRFLLAHYPAAYAVDRTQGTHAIKQELANLQDAGSLYGAIIYHKAPIVMRKLERKIGAGVMRQGLQQYLNDFAFKNATWDDLIAILDSASQEDVTQWSNEWVKMAGMPRITPYLRTEKDSTIKQFGLVHQGDRKLWTQNLAVLLEAEDSMYHFDVTLKGKGVVIEEARGLRAATFIMCNSQGYGYGYFRLGPQTRKRWLEQMQGFADPVMRGVGWLSLWESFLYKRVRPEELLAAMLDNLPVEADPLIQQYILGRLEVLYWKFLPPEMRRQYAPQVEGLLWQQLQTLSDNKLRKAYLNTFRSVALTDEAVAKLAKLWRQELTVEGVKLSQNDFTQLAAQLALRAWPGYEEILDEQLARLTNPDRKARLAFVRPALSADQQVRDAFFASLKKPKNREHEAWVLEAVGYLHHPLRAQGSAKYVLPTLDLLWEIQRTGDIFFPKRLLDKTFWGHQSFDVANEVRQFLYRNNHYPLKLKDKILQSVDLTFRAAEIVRDTRERE